MRHGKPHCSVPPIAAEIGNGAANHERGHSFDKFVMKEKKPARADGDRRETEIQ